MWQDPIVAEVHRAREKLAKESNHDIRLFFAGLRQRQIARQKGAGSIAGEESRSSGNGKGSEGQPLEIVFGSGEGDQIRFRVLELTCPEADEDWYRSQLNVEILIHVGTFHGYRSLVMFSDDFHLFRAALERLLSGEIAGAWLETGDYLSVDVSAVGSSYSARMQLDALEQDGEMLLRDGGNENWEWHVAMNRASLDTLIAAVTRASERYPTWSVPRS